MKLQKNVLFWLFLAGIAVAAGAFSLYIGMKQSVWFDEAYSIMVAQQSVAQIIYLVGVDTHPPLYYVLLHAWGNLFSWDIFALRVLSVGFYVLSILAAGALAKYMFGRRVALYAILAVAAAPLLMRYGFEIRMYSLASLIGVLATHVLVRTVNETKGRRQMVGWAMYAVLVAMGVYSLYYLVLLWIAHVVWLVARSGGLKKAFEAYKQPWVWAYVSSVVLFLPWLPAFLKQVNNGALAPIGQAMTLENIINTMTFNIAYQPLWQITIYETIVAVTMVVAGSIVVRAAYKHIRVTERTYMWLLGVYLVVPIILLMLLSFARPMYVERYLSHVAIGSMLLIGCLIGCALRMPTRKTMLASAVIVASLAGGIFELYRVGNYNFQRMARPEVQQIAQRITGCADTTIAAADPYVAIELAVYVPKGCLYFYSPWDKLGGGYAPLNKSPAQFYTTTIPASTSNLFYVYYDQPKLTVPALYRQVASATVENLTITQYQLR